MAINWPDMHAIAERLAGNEHVQHLAQKGVSYWVSVALIIAVCTLGSGYVYDRLGLRDVRSWIFQWLLDHGPRPAQPNYVKIVLIGDREYWEGEAAGRRPIKRTYLKSLIDHLVEDKAYVIALDFDVRTPNPNSLDIQLDYEDETLKLIEAIVGYAAKGTKFVLATPIFWDEQNQVYHQDRDPYQAYGLCRPNGTPFPKEGKITDELAGAIKATRNTKITCGYIHLPDDPLVIPSRVTLDDGRELDSFALAVAIAGWPDFESVRRLGSNIRYGNFISEARLADPAAKALFSASAVLEHGDKQEAVVVKSTLQSRPVAVVVGGNWHQWAVDRGPMVDSHATPVGDLAGAVLWANYIEAIVDRRQYFFVSPEVLHALEVLFSVIAAIILALSPSTKAQIGWLVTLCLVLLVIQYVALHGFALFFDAYVPLVGLALHSLSEQLWVYWQRNRKLAAQKAARGST